MKRRNETTNTQPEGLHRPSGPARRNRSARALITLSVGLVLTGALAVSLTASNLFGSFDNPVDPWSDDFQGFLSVDVKDMAVSGHVLMVTENGDLYAWGENFDGQLGIGETDDMYGPLSVGLENIVEVAAGSAHSLALDADNTLWGWGGVKSHELGTDVNGEVLEGGENRQYMEPVRLKENILSACAGDHFSAVMDGNGKIYAWGAINSQRDFEGDMLFQSAEPVEIAAPPGKTIKEFVGSPAGLGIVTEDGEFWWWGWSEATEEWQDTFAKLDGIPEVTTVAPGGVFLLALSSAGELWSLGKNDRGQTGTGDNTPAIVPITTAGFMDIAAGGDSSFAVTEEGKLFVWGSNENGLPRSALLAV